MKLRRDSGFRFAVKQVLDTARRNERAARSGDLSSQNTARNVDIKTSRLLTHVVREAMLTGSERKAFETFRSGTDGRRAASSGEGVRDATLLRKELVKHFAELDPVLSWRGSLFALELLLASSRDEIRRSGQDRSSEFLSKGGSLPVSIRHLISNGASAQAIHGCILTAIHRSGRIRGSWEGQGRAEGMKDTPMPTFDDGVDPVEMLSGTSTSTSPSVFQGSRLHPQDYSEVHRWINQMVTKSMAKGMESKLQTYARSGDWVNAVTVYARSLQRFSEGVERLEQQDKKLLRPKTSVQRAPATRSSAKGAMSTLLGIQRTIDTLGTQKAFLQGVPRASRISFLKGLRDSDEELQKLLGQVRSVLPSLIAADLLQHQNDRSLTGKHLLQLREQLSLDTHLFPQKSEFDVPLTSSPQHSSTGTGNLNASIVDRLSRFHLVLWENLQRPSSSSSTAGAPLVEKGLTQLLRLLQPPDGYLPRASEELEQHPLPAEGGIPEAANQMSATTLPTLSSSLLPSAAMEPHRQWIKALFLVGRIDDAYEALKQNPSLYFEVPRSTSLPSSSRREEGRTTFSLKQLEELFGTLLLARSTLTQGEPRPSVSVPHLNFFFLAQRESRSFGEGVQSEAQLMELLKRYFHSEDWCQYGAQSGDTAEGILIDRPQVPPTEASATGPLVGTVVSIALRSRDSRDTTKKNVSSAEAQGLDDGPSNVRNHQHPAQIALSFVSATGAPWASVVYKPSFVSCSAPLLIETSTEPSSSSSATSSSTSSVSLAAPQADGSAQLSSAEPQQDVAAGLADVSHSLPALLIEAMEQGQGSVGRKAQDSRWTYSPFSLGGLVNRLDWPVSGLLLASHSLEGLLTLRRCLQRQHSVEKEYLLLCSRQSCCAHATSGSPNQVAGSAGIWGSTLPDRAWISLPTTRRLERLGNRIQGGPPAAETGGPLDDQNRQSLLEQTGGDEVDEDVDDDGDNETDATQEVATTTEFEVVRRFQSGRVCLVRVKLRSGRYHQIRQHFAAVGWPLLGDATYGGPTSVAEARKLGIDRCALHAAFVGLPHSQAGGPELHLSRGLREGDEPVTGSGIGGIGNGLRWVGAVQVSCELPEDFIAALETLSRSEAK
jgi:hypothetical protein